MVERAWFDSKIAQKGQVHFTLSEKKYIRKYIQQQLLSL